MTFKNLISLLFVLIICSCADKRAGRPFEKYFGVYITNDARRGSDYVDPAGTKYAYRFVRAHITNDSLIPLHIKVAFSKEYYQPTPSNGQQFKVFLLPDTMMSVNHAGNAEVKRFLDTESELPFTLNRVINPQEECIINIGFLSEIGSDLEPLPMMLFSKGHRHNFISIPDSAIQQVKSAKNQLALLLGLDFHLLGEDSVKRYSLIPCGQVSFSD